MRSIVRTLQVGLVLAAGVVLVSSGLKSQAPARAAAQTWEYVMVAPSPGIYGDKYKTGTRASVCFASADGCREESVTATKDNQDSSSINPDAVMKASNDLGAQGWELVSASQEKLYFRRPKR